MDKSIEQLKAELAEAEAEVLFDARASVRALARFDDWAKARVDAEVWFDARVERIKSEIALKEQGK